MPRDYMGAAHIAATGVQSGTFQPQHQNNFLFEVTLEDIGIDAGLLSLAAESFSGVNVSSDEVEIPFLNERRYVAGQAQFDAGTLTLRDFVDVEVMKLFASWRNRVYAPISGKVGWATDYKRTADLVMLAPDGSGDRIWKLVGCWPQAVNYGNYDHNGSDVVKIEATIRFDLALPDRLGIVTKGAPNPIVP